MQIYALSQLWSLYHIKLDIHQARDPPSDSVSTPDWPHPAGCSCEHQVPFLQGEVLGYEAQQCRHIEDHIFRVPVLPRLLVDLTPEVDVVRVGDAGDGDEAADWETGVEHLSQGPGMAFRFSLVLQGNCY